jgi:hypothetical protein
MLDVVGNGAVIPETPVSNFGVSEAVKSQWTVPEAVWEKSREG